MDWATTLIGVGIDVKTAKEYAKVLDDNCINDSNMEMLDKETLKELGIALLGHQMSILKICKKQDTRMPDQQPQMLAASVRVAAAKAPCLRTEMTPQ